MRTGMSVVRRISARIPASKSMNWDGEMESRLRAAGAETSEVVESEWGRLEVLSLRGEVVGVIRSSRTGGIVFVNGYWGDAEIDPWREVVWKARVARMGRLLAHRLTTGEFLPWEETLARFAGEGSRHRR